MEQNRKTDTFRDLKCWQDCRELRCFVARRLVPLLPREERFRLGDQMIRAARSTTANIAEGYGRYHYLDEIKFCNYARGSCYEVIDHAIAANDEEMIPEDVLRECETLATRAIQRLNGYTAYLRRRLKEPPTT